MYGHYIPWETSYFYQNRDRVISTKQQIEILANNNKKKIFFHKSNKQIVQLEINWFERYSEWWKIFESFHAPIQRPIRLLKFRRSRKYRETVSYNKPYQHVCCSATTLKCFRNYFLHRVILHLRFFWRRNFFNLFSQATVSVRFKLRSGQVSSVRFRFFSFVNPLSRVRRAHRQLKYRSSCYLLRNVRCYLYASSSSSCFSAWLRVQNVHGRSPFVDSHIWAVSWKSIPVSR